MLALAHKWAALAVLPLLVALGQGPSSRAFVCLGDEVARTACCCPEELSPIPTTPWVTTQCCCDVVHVIVSSTPAEPAKQAANAVKSPEARVAIDAEPASLVPAGLLAFEAAVETPPPLQLPVLLRKQSFLL